MVLIGLRGNIRSGSGCSHSGEGPVIETATPFGSVIASSANLFLVLVRYSSISGRLLRPANPTTRSTCPTYPKRMCCKVMVSCSNTYDYTSLPVSCFGIPVSLGNSLQRVVRTRRSKDTRRS